MQGKKRHVVEGEIQEGIESYRKIGPSADRAFVSVGMERVLETYGQEKDFSERFHQGGKVRSIGGTRLLLECSYSDKKKSVRGGGGGCP